MNVWFTRRMGLAYLALLVDVHEIPLIAIGTDTKNLTLAADKFASAVNQNCIHIKFSRPSSPRRHILKR